MFLYDMRKLAVILIFVLAFYPSLICLAATFNSSTDESSLLSLKAQITSKPNNILSTNWSRGTSFCTWTGVSCSRRHQRVTGLDLFNMSLEGTIAREVGNLSFLTYLSIADNSFRGVIPDEIGNLIHLRMLNLSFNQLGGNIPQSFGLLRNLERLELAGNNLVGSIPTGLSLCGELKWLSLSYNQLTGSIPMAIGNLSKLQTLDLEQNELTGNFYVLILYYLILFPTTPNLFTSNLFLVRVANLCHAAIYCWLWKHPYHVRANSVVHRKEKHRITEIHCLNNKFDVYCNCISLKIILFYFYARINYITLLKCKRICKR